MVKTMNKLGNLIREFCPQGVERKRLGDIGVIVRGNGLQKKDFTESGVGCIHYGQIYTYYGTCAYKTKSFVSPELAEKLQKVNKGDLVIAVTSENVEDVGKCVVWLGDEQIVTGAHAAIFRHNQDPKYVAYWFQTNDFFTQKKRIAKGTKVIDLTPQKLEEVTMPVPPLPVQREIVRILDNFAELTAELTARKKQYEYYRDTLLTFGVHRGGTFKFGNGAESKNVPLSELAQFTYGYTDKAKDTGNARFIRITDINDDGCLNSFDAKYITLTDESKKYLLKKGDLLLARTGATYGKTLYVPDDTPAVYASFLIKITLDNSRILNRYYWHFSKSNLYWTQAEKFVSKGGQQQFNSSAVGRVVVPLPSLDVQQKIVDVLDNFDAICSDLNIGLPAEIEARKKQYEYYRDMLLTFAVADDIILTDRQTDRA